MPANETEAERKLRTLSKRLKQGWAEIYPVPETAMKKVRDAVREQWEKEQEVKQRVEKARQGQEQRSGPGEQKSGHRKGRSAGERSRTKDWGHGH